MARTATPRKQAGDKANGALPARRLFDVDEYHRMGEVGILRHNDRVELWEGEIVQMPPIGSDHAGSTGDLTSVLVHNLHGRAIVWVQNPVRLSRRSEPQPDVLVLRLREDRYHGSLPGPEDVRLLIEVSDTTFHYDRYTKLPRYAQAGIPEVWIADVRRKRLLVFRKPEDGKYTEQLTFVPGDAVSPLTFPDVTIHVAGVFA